MKTIGWVMTILGLLITVTCCLMAFCSFVMLITDIHHGLTTIVLSYRNILIIIVQIVIAVASFFILFVPGKILTEEE